MRLIQLLASHHRHDAVGAETLVIEKLLKGMGWQVENYSEFIDDSLKGKTRHISELEGQDLSNTVALYHFCVCSDVTFVFQKLKCPKVMIYHNITPPDFFRPYNIYDAGICEEAGRQVRLLVDDVDLALGDSEFNRLELEQMGYKNTRRMPILFDPDNYHGELDLELKQQFGDKHIVLFVGRMAPNKAPDDLMRVAAAYKKNENYPPAKFVIAGKRHVTPKYTEYLDKLYQELGLTEDDFMVLDEINQNRLVTCYREASVFLSMSRHEGFFVPLLESFLFSLPVMAYAGAAVPETLGDAGYLLDSTIPEVIAGHLANYLSDKKLQEVMAEKGRERLKDFDMHRWKFVLDIQLKKVLQGGFRGE
jgi:glycosyltransferase involved in cell wall biosynthesis